MNLTELLAAGGLATSYQTIRPDEAERIAYSCYGIDGQAQRLATEKDDTFRIRTVDSTFILKIANPAENEAEIDMQISLLDFLQERHPDLSVPRVVRTKDALPCGQYRQADGVSRTVRLMTYLDGTPLSDVVADPALRSEVGSILARLRLAMTEFSHPADSRTLLWDVRHLMTLEPLLDVVIDADQKKSLVRAMDRFSSLQPRIEQCRRQVVHNDFSRSNVVVGGTARKSVTGVIDFGDAIRTAIAVDVSTAMLNQLRSDRSQDILADGFELLQGYLAIADLTDEELSLIPHLTMARVVARALLTTWRAGLFPENAEYIIRNTYPGWAQLSWFLDRDRDSLSMDFITRARALQRETAGIKA